jgi:mannan endo-1,4-beta-mannosidase
METPRTLAPQTQALRDFLLSLRGRWVLSGQHNYINAGARYTDRVEEITGRRPILWGSDFSFAVAGDNPRGHYHCGTINISDPGDGEPHFIDMSVEESRGRMIECAIEQHRRGHIVTLMWHECFPSLGDKGEWDSVWQAGKLPQPEVWRELITPGTDLHEAWLAQIDRVAAYLRMLRDEGIPVLWRPYHEMNGVWFWWCNKPGPDGFARLWRMMFDRYTNHHGLDNLLWVWNTNAPRDRAGDEAYDYAGFYPGADYVDVLAADVYGNDYRQSHHDDLARLADGKPIALGEVGDVPTPEILEQQPQWCWFMPWGCLVDRRANETKVPELYACERVLAMDDVSRRDNGTYHIAR